MTEREYAGPPLLLPQRILTDYLAGDIFVELAGAILLRDFTARHVLHSYEQESDRR